MRKIKAAWLWFWRLPPYVSLLFSLALIGWTQFDKVQRDHVRQQQRIELNAIDLERDKLGRDIERYKGKYSALFAKKQWSEADKVQAKLAYKELKSLSARLDEIKRRTSEVCPPDKNQYTRLWRRYFVQLKMTTRRELLKAMAATTCAGAFVARGAVAASAPSPDPAPAAVEPQRTSIDELIGDWMKMHNVPALSLAFARSDELLFRKAWGVSEWGGDAATAESLFRIASVTKPMTAVAIFLLIERNYLKLDDHVFGTDGLLNGEFGADLPENLNAITVRHLLMHESGGWPNDAHGPTLRHAEMPQREWLEWVLRRRPLQYAPGEKYVYSNVGYCLLGWIIGKLTAQSYADWVRENVLAPCKITQMRLATREQTADEVRYYDQTGDDPYTRNMARLEACAGWLATPTDLVRFATRFPQLLKSETVKTMTTPDILNPNIACGWSVNDKGTIWHSGGIAGSNALVVRLKSGMSWAVLINTNGKESLQSLNELMWKIASGVPAWKV